MKKNLKMLSLLVIGTSMVLTGCGTVSTGDTPDDPNKTTIRLEVLKAGLGSEAYEKLAAAYMAAHPDVVVKIILNREINNTVELTLQQGTNVSDIYCIRDINKIKRLYSLGYIRDLTETYNSVIEDGKTMLEMIDESAANYSNYNGKYICIPEYVNVNGFVYNKKLFDKYGWTIPKTTEEFKTLCDKILEDTNGAVKPIVFTKDAGGYVYYLLNGINTSYEGIANMDEIHKFETSEIFNPSNRTGKRYALETMQQFLTESHGYVFKGSIGLSNENAIKTLMIDKAAMMINGSWFETESAAIKFHTDNNEMSIFRIPEYSVGGVVQRAPGYTSEEGKGIVHSEYTANYIVPTKAKNAETAIDFLKFISRKDMCELYTKCCNCIRPFDYNKDSTSESYSEVSTFGKAVLDIADRNTLYVPVSTNQLAITGRISLWPVPDDTYHMNRLLVEGDTPQHCLELEYAAAKEALGD